MPLAGLGIIGAVGSVAGGAIAAHGAGKAADAQVAAANHAADLQHQDAQAALDFQNKQFGIQQGNVAPWLNIGRSGLTNLASLMGILPNDSGSGLNAGANGPDQQLQNWHDPSMLPQNLLGDMSNGGNWPTSGNTNLQNLANPPGGWNPFADHNPHPPVQNYGQPSGIAANPNVTPPGMLGLPEQGSGTPPNATPGLLGGPEAAPGGPSLGGGPTAAGPTDNAATTASGTPAQLTVPLNSLTDGSGANAAAGAGQADNAVSAGGVGMTPGRAAGDIQPLDGGGDFPNLPSNIQDKLAGNGALDPNAVPAAPNPNTNLSSLVNPNLGNFGSLLQPWKYQFAAPTSVTEQNDPGYRFRLEQGQQAINNSAAARGDVLSGGTLKALDQYNQGFASNEYGNVYNRALNNYQTAYNQFQQGQSDKFNRLAAIAGIGQTAAGQLNSSGINAANNVSSILLNSGAQIGQNINNAGAARASGYAGSANAIGGAVGGIGSNLTNLFLLNSLLNKGGSSSGAFDPTICWIAEALYGVDDVRTHLVRKWLIESFSKHPIGSILVGLYKKYGERIAELVKKYKPVRAFFRPIFDAALSRAIEYAQGLADEPQLENYESLEYQR